MLPRNLQQLAVTATFAVVLAACSSSGTANSARTTDQSVGRDTTTVPSPDSADDEAADFDQLISDFVGEAPGGADLLVISDGLTTRAAAGIASSSGDALTPGRPFRVGSISKVFVATMVLQLVEEDLVDLDAPLATYLAETPVGGDITIRELLAHTSGIANYTERVLFFPAVLAERSRHFSPAEIVETVADVPHGERGVFSYSNTNYILLGQLIEAVDDSDLGVSLRDRVTGPAGLDDTVFGDTADAQPSDLVGGWSAGLTSGDPAEQYESIASSAWAAGALISTTDDLAALATALRDGTLVSGDSFAAMTTTGSAGNGLGLFATPLDESGEGVGHGGSIPGYQSQLAFDPVNGTIIVALTNSDTLQPWLLTTEVAAAIAN